MAGSGVRRGLVVILIIGWGLFVSSPAAAERADAYNEAVARVLRLLPRQPEKVVLIDADTAPRLLHDKLQHVEGFITRGESVVYLVRQGETLQRAIKGAGIFDYVLATIVWHEMAHIDGSDEAKAQQAEEDLWMQFVLARRMDGVRGLNYLGLLRKRR